MEEKFQGINVIELGSSSGCVPKGLYLVHINCLTMSGTSKQDLISIVERLFCKSEVQSLKPQLIWALYYNISFLDEVSSPSLPHNLIVANGPVFDIDYGRCIREANAIFDQMFPNEEFLPKAPDADDIVIEVENGDKNNE